MTAVSSEIARPLESFACFRALIAWSHFHGALLVGTLFVTLPAAADMRTDDLAKLKACLAAAVPWKEASACIGIVDAPCQAEGNYSTQNMVECMARERQTWGSIMDEALIHLHWDAKEADRVTPGATLDDALTASQDAWHAFHEAHCHYWRQRNFDGSIARLNATACSLRMTAERAIELDRFVRHGK